MAKKFKFGSGTKAKINKQDTRHGKLDMPFASLKKYAGKAEGGEIESKKMEQEHASTLSRIAREEAAEAKKMAIGGPVGAALTSGIRNLTNSMTGRGPVTPGRGNMSPRLKRGVTPSPTKSSMAAPPAAKKFAKGGGIECKGRTRCKSV